MSSGEISAFNALVIISFILGFFVLSTAIFSSKVQRPPRWYGLLVPVFFYDIMLMLSMGFQTDAGPPLALCGFQAILLYSIPGWVVVAFGCFILDFYVELKRMAQEEEEEDAIPYFLSKRAVLLVVATPLVAFVIFLLINGLAVTLSSQNPSVAMNKFKLYCTTTTHTGLYVGGSLMCIAMAIWIYVIVRAGMLLKRHYARLQGSVEIMLRQVLSIYLRTTAIFVSCSVVIALYLSSVLMHQADSLLYSYCLALPSIIVFIVFGTQKDILDSWAFWRRCSEPKYKFSAGNSSERSVTTEITETKRASVWHRIGYNWNVGTRTRVDTSTFQTSTFTP